MKKLTIDADKLSKIELEVIGRAVIHDNCEYNWKDIKSYEDSILVRSIDPEDIIYPTDSSKVIADKKISHYVKVLNGKDFKFDLFNTNQKKWSPIFKVLPSGLAFDDSDYCYDYAITFVGSRFALESEEKADHAGKCIIDLYLEQNK